MQRPIARKWIENSKKKVKDKEGHSKHKCTILLLALTSWDKKLEIPIPCPDAKAEKMQMTQGP